MELEIKIRGLHDKICVYSFYGLTAKDIQPR